MLRVFQIRQNNKIEILPIGKIFTVCELGNYEIIYTSKNIISHNVFLEDIPIDISNIQLSDDKLVLSEFRYFEDYFGYASLNINNDIFLFNIKIEKLKLSEIEDIFIYLWEKEDKLFNIFFSKSTYQIDFKRNGSELGQTSKLITFIEKFILTFDKLYFSFEKLPHTVLRKQVKQIKYDSLKITSDSVTWILNNLDEIHFDNSLRGHHNSIKINNKYGLIGNIKVSENTNSFNNYENQIILGAFTLLLRLLNRLKSEIKSNINIQPKKDEEYADFKDLKKIAFIKLFTESSSLEKKVNKLFLRYRKLFKNTIPKTRKPILTTVFSQKTHYRKVFLLIKNLNEFRFDLFGEFKLLNIRKLSTLYEVYNLYIILDSIKKKLKLDLFCITAHSNRDDEIIEVINFDNPEHSIKLFYEHKFYDISRHKQETELRRIDTKRANYYCPDYIIEIYDKNKKTKKYYILDAKYSKFHNVKHIHLPNLIKKYIINTGIYSNPSIKISSLNLIFPGDFSQKIVESSYFEPTIELTNSKPKFNKELDLYISQLLNNNLPQNYLKTSNIT